MSEPWLQECERIAVFARQFYEREGQFSPMLDVLTAGGDRHCLHLSTANPEIFVSIRRDLGPALAYCFSTLGSIVEKRGAIESSGRCLIVMAHDVGGFWYGRAWRVGKEGKLDEGQVLTEALTMMDLLLVADGGQG